MPIRNPLAIWTTLLCFAAPAYGQRLLGDVSHAIPDTLVLSPDGKRFAVVTVDPPSKARQVIVDGKRMGKKYDSIAEGTPIFSSDGQHIAFVARSGRHCYVVKDGVESDGYLLAPDGWPISSLVFGAGGQLAFKARVDGRTMVGIDRQHLGPYEVWLDNDGNRLWGVWDFCFSRDGSWFAYRARIGERMSLVTGKTVPDPTGKEPRLSISPAYDSIGSGTPVPVPGLGSNAFAYIAVTKGGEYVAVWNGTETKLGEDYHAIARRSLVVPPYKSPGVDFIARKGRKWAAVISGKEGPLFDEINSFMYTAGGRHAYAARRGDSIIVVVDGVESSELDGVRFPGTVFSPDGKHVAYAARLGNVVRVVLDGEPGPRFDLVDGNSLTFSPDGAHLAYVAQKAGKQFVVIDGQTGPEFERVAMPRYSRDGSRFGYRASTGLDHFVVIDNERFGPFADVSPDSPAFSDDGQRLAFAALKHGEWRVTLNGKEEPPCEGIVSRLTFTKEGLTYVGKFIDRGQDKVALVANGKPGKFYDAIWLGNGGQLLLNTPPHEYFGQLGPVVYRDRIIWEAN